MMLRRLKLPLENAHDKINLCEKGNCLTTKKFSDSRDSANYLGLCKRDNLMYDERHVIFSLRCYLMNFASEPSLAAFATDTQGRGMHAG
eukprot:6211193-Pleurochrysis_carterae.AAC.3